MAQRNCFYCDRASTTQKYESSSCVICCTECSLAKGKMNQSSFIKMVERIYLNRIIKSEGLRSVFVGRWQPFHSGHETIIRQKLEAHPVLILVRDTPIDTNNPYGTAETVDMIRAAFEREDVVVLPIPDIEGIYYGRKVGYNVEELEAPSDICRISATEIRSKIEKKDFSWKKFVNDKVAAWLECYYKMGVYTVHPLPEDITPNHRGDWDPYDHKDNYFKK